MEKMLDSLHDTLPFTLHNYHGKQIQGSKLHSFTTLQLHQPDSTPRLPKPTARQPSMQSTNQPHHKSRSYCKTTPAEDGRYVHPWGIHYANHLAPPSPAN